MLDNFGGDDDVECAPFGGKRFGGRRAIVDRQALLLRMERCDADRLLDRVNSCYTPAEPRQRFRQDAASAAGVENREAIQGAKGLVLLITPTLDLGDNEGEPRRIKCMETTKFAALVPPILSKPFEMTQLGRIKRWAMPCFCLNPHRWRSLYPCAVSVFAAAF